MLFKISPCFIIASSVLHFTFTAFIYLTKEYRERLSEMIEERGQNISLGASENTKRFFYNGILLTALGISMRTVSLFFNAFITRTIGAEGVGLYTVVNTVYGFSVTFATAGISLTVTRLVASARGEGREESVPRILSGAILYALCFSTVAALVLYFGAGSFAAAVLDDIRAASSLRILAPSLVPLSLVSVFSGYFIGIKKVARNAITQVIGQSFKICATVWLCHNAAPLGVERSAMMLSLGTTVTEIVCFTVIFFEFLLERRGSRGERGADLVSVARVAAPLGISAYIRQALLTIEHIIIPKRLRVYGSSHGEALSAYGTLHGMALPMILYPMVTLSSFSGLLVPEFAERESADDKAGMRRLAERAFATTLVYAVLSAALLFVFSEELGYVVYKSRDAGTYIAALASVVPIMYLDHVTDSVLKGIGEQVYSMWVNITDSLLSIFLVWLLIPKMGIMGYAVCIIAMEAYNFTLSLVRLCKRIRFRIPLLASVVFPAASALVSGFLVKRLFISAGRETSPLWLALEIIFAVCVFAGSYRGVMLIYDGARIKIKNHSASC